MVHRTTLTAPITTTGAAKSVSSQASEMHKREIGITPFDCPRDNCDLIGTI